MRLALVCPYSLSRPGGVQGQVLGLAGALARAGESVVVVAPLDPADPGAPTPLELLSPEVEVCGVGRSLALPANGSRAPVAPGPAALRRAVLALRRARPDVVHVHEPFVPGACLAPLLDHRAPVLATFHRAGASPAYRTLRPLARLALARVEECVAVSEAARQTLEAVGGPLHSPCDLVANGVDVGRFAGAAAWPPEGATVVFVGRHERRKGLTPLLEAFAALPVEARLWVVGAGPETASLRSRSTDSRISWLGQLGEADLASRVAGADLLVAPSLGGESFGVVLLEAMAAGTAVLASDLPGYRAAAGDAARYVPPGDVAALHSAMAELLARDDERQRLVAAGRARAAGHSFDALAGSYLERYRRLAGRWESG